MASERRLRAPVLLFQGSADTVVPPDLAARFARARPRLVTYVPIEGADHTAEIDTAPHAYQRALVRFLSPYPDGAARTGRAGSAHGDAASPAPGGRRYP
jgi:pimeloyl-ACP methyl ester carboxylesterase